MMKPTIAAIAALAAIGLFTSCAKDVYGQRKGWVEQWQTMRERQDRDAREFALPYKRTRFFL